MIVQAIPATGPDVDALAVVLALVAGMALIARRSGLPETVILVSAGLLGSGLGWGVPLHLSPNIILHLFLPPLLFEAAFQLDLRMLRQHAGSVLLLAVPGVLLSAAVAGSVVHLSLSLPWAGALLFGGIMAATDPVAVLALFRRLSVPPALAVVVESESLFNDGTALVLFGALLSVAMGYRGPADQTVALLWQVAGGSIIGVILGYLGSLVTALIDDHLVEMTLSTALAFGSYVGASAVGGSGVLATVFAGLIFGTYGRRVGMSETTQRLLDDLWEYLAFIANALLFLLVGVTVPVHELLAMPGAVAEGIAAVLLGRIVLLYGLGSLRPGHAERLPWKYRHVLFWGGLRGAVSIAATLSLPQGLAHHQQIQTLAYGAIVFTLLVQGITVEPLVRWLGLDSHGDLPAVSDTVSTAPSRRTRSR